MTVSPSLKTMMDRMEVNKPVMLSLAWNVEAQRDAISRTLSLPPLGANPVTVLGLSLHMKEKVLVLAGLECNQIKTASTLRLQVRQALEPLRLLAGMMKFKLEFEDEQQSQGASGNPMGMGNPPHTHSGPQVAGSEGPGPMPAPMGPMAGGSPPSSGSPSGPGPTGAPPPEQAGPPGRGTLRLGVNQEGKNVVLSVDWTLEPETYAELTDTIGAGWVAFRGQLERILARPRWQELAAGSTALRDTLKHFPRGTWDRRPSELRANRPWPPDQRMSWLADLLPYLGYKEVYEKINKEKSWQDQANFNPSMVLIPQFLDPQHPQAWRVFYPRAFADVEPYPGRDTARAATHFVGIAGVGLDAAEYGPNDPETASKAGIFGYDRITRLEDVKNGDGLSNTILMAEVPPPFQGPWMAGGGSTIRGVPETGSVRPFISTTDSKGRRGTMVIMADGSVRFIAETIADDVFKALATVRGGEKVDIEKEAPKMTPPDGTITELKPKTIAPPPPEKKPMSPPTKEEGKKEEGKKDKPPEPKSPKEK